MAQNIAEMPHLLEIELQHPAYDPMCDARLEIELQRPAYGRTPWNRDSDDPIPHGPMTHLA